MSMTPIHFYDGSKYIMYYVDEQVFLAYLDARNVRLDADKFDGNLNAAITDVQKLAEIVDLLKKQVGPAGADGRDGEDGQPGAQGEPGQPGADGRDGEPGQPGADGRDGERGLAGENGQRGIDGKDGKPGSAGRDGADGRDGEKGEKGERGADGREGLDGKDGKAGACGLPGIPGPMGTAGRNGADGRDGEKGEKGERGPAGKAGEVRVVRGGGGGGLADALRDGSTYGRKDGAWAVVSSGVTDHGALTGLEDDDHTQYHNDTRGDARYALIGHTHAQLHDAATVSATANGLSVAAGQVFSLAAATAVNAGAATAAQITKLDGIEVGANNYVHPNHSGHVISVADGATTIVAGVVTPAMLSVASAQYKYLVAGVSPFAYAESAGALNIVAGKTLTVSESVTLAASAAGYTLTVPATMIAAGRNVENVFTVPQKIAYAGADQLLISRGGAQYCSLTMNAASELVLFGWVGTIISPASASATGLILRGNVSQTGNVLEIQDSSLAVHNSLAVPGPATAHENVFNQAGSPLLDFRIETDSYNALFVDASANSIVIMSNAAGKIGLFGATAIVQPAGATQAAPAAYVTGGFGLDSDANMLALYDLVVAMRLALVNLGAMKGAA